MIFNYTNGTERQVALFKAALAACSYPLSMWVSNTITVSWVQNVSVPEHSAFAATTMDGSGGGSMQIRSDLDKPNRDPEWTGDNFYMETVLHELGHVIAGIKEVSAAQATPLFAAKEDGGYPGPEGDDGDWDNGAWQARIQEAVAETFKDLWMDKSKRVYDNRTNWILQRSKLQEYVDLMWPPNPEAPHGDGEYGTSHGGFLADQIYPAHMVELLDPGDNFPPVRALTGDTEYISDPTTFSEADYREMYEISEGAVQFDFDYSMPLNPYDPAAVGEEGTWYFYGAAQGWGAAGVALNSRQVNGDGVLTPGWATQVELRDTIGAEGNLRRTLWRRVGSFVPTFSGKLAIPTWDELNGEAAITGVRFRIFTSPLGTNLIQRGFPIGSGGPGALLPASKDMGADWRARHWTMRYGAAYVEQASGSDIPLPPWPYDDTEVNANASPGPGARVRRYKP